MAFMMAIKKINNRAALHDAAQENRRLKPFENSASPVHLTAVQDFTKWSGAP